MSGSFRVHPGRFNDFFSAYVLAASMAVSEMSIPTVSRPKDEEM